MALKNWVYAYALEAYEQSLKIRQKLAEQDLVAFYVPLLEHPHIAQNFQLKHNLHCQQLAPA
jgi:hypothetical protein